MWHEGWAKPSKYDPEEGKVFGVNRAEFEENDELRVETERKILDNAKNQHRVVCMVRDEIEKWSEEGIPDDMVEVMEQLAEWYEALANVTKW